jgi:hypothetical protein
MYVLNAEVVSSLEVLQSIFCVHFFSVLHVPIISSLVTLTLFWIGFTMILFRFVNLSDILSGISSEE